MQSQIEHYRRSASLSGHHLPVPFLSLIPDSWTGLDYFLASWPSAIDLGRFVRFRLDRTVPPSLVDIGAGICARPPTSPTTGVGSLLALLVHHGNAGRPLSKMLM